MQILASAPSLERHPGTDPTIPLPPRLLSALAFTHAAVAKFEAMPDPPPGERTSERVFCSETHDIWLIRWGAGARTELHDHGDSAGALCRRGRARRAPAEPRRPRPTAPARPA